MTPLDLESLQAALAAGPTPGPWNVGRFGAIHAGQYHSYVNGTAQEQLVSVFPMSRSSAINPDQQREIDTTYIGACDPTTIGALVAELTARRAREEAVEAIAAADNTLHSAMDHWQERARRAEAALRARDAELEALRNVRRRISAVVQGTDDLRSEALVEVRELLSWGHAIDAALRPFHSGSDAEGESK